MFRMLRSNLQMLLICVAVLGICISSHAQEPKTSRVIAKIQGQEITEDDLQYAFYTRGLKADAPEQEQLKIINQLIDKRLIRLFLEANAVTPDEMMIETEIQRLKDMIIAQGSDVNEVLQKYSLSEADLRSMMWVSAAWEKYIDQQISLVHYRFEWDGKKHAYDGTRIHGSQIVIHVKASAPTSEYIAAEERLSNLRNEILQGKITFADAAKANSQSPSSTKGGDMGEFEFSGRVDESISTVAFRLAPGDISYPFRTRYGVHLVQVHKRVDGNLSLEDAVPEIRSKFSKGIWTDTVLTERKNLKIEILIPGK